MNVGTGIAKYKRFQLMAYLTLAALLTIGGISMAWRPSLAPSGYVQGEWIRTSQYVSVRDGTKLAVDIFRPVQNGEVVSEPLPVVWTNSRYHRADIANGRLATVLNKTPWLETLLRNNYVVAAADIRGTGASFGTWEGPFSQKERDDAYDLTEWFATQPWSNGRIGMFGRSHMGLNQLAAASVAPPHLIAIFPEMSIFDGYESSYTGGVFRAGVGKTWTDWVRNLDVNIPAAPVDVDTDGTLLAMAVAEHQPNVDLFQRASRLPYRDSIDAATGQPLHATWSPSTYLDDVEKSGVAIYHLTGWYDLGSRDTLVWFNNLSNPQKIVVGPWNHSGSEGFDLGQEHLRWYDYWLKGIDNGIMNEPPIRYQTIGAPSGSQWRSATRWPPRNIQSANYYFQGGNSGSVGSINDGLLTTQPPTEEVARDEDLVDYTTSSGAASRWTTQLSGVSLDIDLASNDEKGLTYTTPPLESDVEVTGHPIVNMWVSSTAEDGDFFVYLEDVDQNGVSHGVSEGVLRASHRATSNPPYDYLGLPYHRGFAQDIAALPREPVELTLDLLPISWVFKSGQRIRITVTEADQGNALTPVLEPSPTVSIHRNALNASSVNLPIVLSSAEYAPSAFLPCVSESGPQQ